MKTSFKKSFLRKYMMRCNQIAIFLEVNLPFNHIVTAKSSVPEQFERSPLWKPCWRLGRIAWRHCAHKKTSAPKWSNVPLLAVQTERSEIPKEGKFPSAALKKSTKGQICPNLASATFDRCTLRRSASKVAVTSIYCPAENVNAT